MGPAFELPARTRGPAGVKPAGKAFSLSAGTLAAAGGKPAGPASRRPAGTRESRRRSSFAAFQRLRFTPGSGVGRRNAGKPGFLASRRKARTPKRRRRRREAGGVRRSSGTPESGDAAKRERSRLSGVPAFAPGFPAFWRLGVERGRLSSVPAFPRSSGRRRRRAGFPAERGKAGPALSAGVPAFRRPGVGTLRRGTHARIAWVACGTPIVCRRIVKTP